MKLSRRAFPAEVAVGGKDGAATAACGGTVGCFASTERDTSRRAPRPPRPGGFSHITPAGWPAALSSIVDLRWRQTRGRRATQSP